MVLEMEDLVKSSGDECLSGDDGRGTSGPGCFCTRGTQRWLALAPVTQCDVTPS